MASPKGTFQDWLKGIRSEALERGIPEKIIQTLLTDVQPNRRVIKRDRNQSEFKLTLQKYRNRVITTKNVTAGRTKVQKYNDLLNKVSSKYGVQRRFIVAIWGIETRYGSVKANIPVIPAVATLAYDARRERFFKKQLFSVLEMVSRGYIGPESLLGSWAGAMGEPQFMPSSYLAFAQDFDGDGRRDIWSSRGDIFASIANYLAKHRWSADQTWGLQVDVPKALITALGTFKRRAAPGCRAKTSELKPLHEWYKLGVRPPDSSFTGKPELKAALVLPDGMKGDSFLVYGNYSAIMSYNCAHHYAITVGLLADKIRNSK
ncbi:MAG: lytic murein transglycosylase [Pseudomonadota bacterium]|nr:lytic murein transglycosylase [Pseudomonadota bacterium]